SIRTSTSARSSRRSSRRPASARRSTPTSGRRTPSTTSSLGVPALPVIRLARDEDVPGLLEIYTPIVRDTPISLERAPPSEAELRARVRASLEMTPWLVWAEGPSDGRAVLGYAYAGPFRARPAYQWTAEATVYVAEAHRGRGVARALYTALFAGLRLLGF